jgi:predicted nucleotidyltransferase
MSTLSHQFPYLCSMKPIELPVVKDVSATLHNLYGERLLKIILYGSYARGDQHEESDIDFLVLLKDAEVSPFKEIDFYIKPISELSDKYKVEISVKAASYTFLQKENNLLAKFVREEGIAVS